jgi:hypothetical protein
MAFLPPRFVHTYVATWFGFMARVCCEPCVRKHTNAGKNNENVFICFPRKKVMRFTNNEFYIRTMLSNGFDIAQAMKV